MVTAVRGYDPDSDRTYLNAGGDLLLSTEDGNAVAIYDLPGLPGNLAAAKAVIGAKRDVLGTVTAGPFEGNARSLSFVIRSRSWLVQEAN